MNKWWHFFFNLNDDETLPNWISRSKNTHLEQETEVNKREPTSKKETAPFSTNVQRGSEKNNLGFINCWICMLKHIQQGYGWEIWKSIEHRKDNISLFQDRSYLNFVQLLTPLVCKMKVKSKDEGLLNGPWFDIVV